MVIPPAHPLILVGVFEPEVVGESSHGDGQLADLFQLYRPLMSSHDERIHPPVRCLKARQEGLLGLAWFYGEPRIFLFRLFRFIYRSEMVKEARNRETALSLAFFA